MTRREYPREKVNLENCAKEPIHIIGKIQAYGTLLVCDPGDLSILQAGENTADFLSKAPGALLGKPLSEILSQPDLEQLVTKLESEDLAEAQPVEIDNRSFLMIAQRSEGKLLLDFEPRNQQEDSLILQKQLTKILNQFSKSESTQALCEVAAVLCREIFGYDRVMIYRFDEDWNGEVFSEARKSEMESWLGLHYPATDIPAQSRKMFLQQRVRVINDVNYTPVALEPEFSPKDGSPVDLSPSALRAVSPIHIEYLQNMGVGASMTASVIVGGKLWGLIACHHNSPRFIDYYQRESCRFLAQMLSTEISLRETNRFLYKTKNSENLRRRLLSQIKEQQELVDALCQGPVKITDLVDSSGAAILFNGKLRCCGSTPNKEQILSLVEEFLGPYPKSLVAVKNLGAVFPKAANYADVASGILGLRLANNKFIIWFRREQVRNVTWGGNPGEKAFFDDQKNRISPRKSFRKWTETVTGTAAAWEDSDISVVRSFRENISHLILERQRREIEALNEQLIGANEELELFSYGLSHDLRAPIRGIQGLLQIIREDHPEEEKHEISTHLDKIYDLTLKMNVLIDDILQYSRLTKTNEFPREEIDTEEVLKEVLEMFRVSRLYPNAAIEIMEGLPLMYGEKSMLFQLWANLVNNALKYSAERPVQEIKIGFRSEGGRILYFVEDNGIGIKEEFLGKIFGSFTRVAGGKYKGSGIGLAVAKKIVEKHQGEIWAESRWGKGSTFFFSLGRQKHLK